MEDEGLEDGGCEGRHFHKMISRSESLRINLLGSFHIGKHCVSCVFSELGGLTRPP